MASCSLRVPKLCLPFRRMQLGISPFSSISSHLKNDATRFFSKSPERVVLTLTRISQHNVPFSILQTTPTRSLVQDASGGGGKEGEQKIANVLKKAFPSASKLRVEDISGGCGSMYQVLVEAKEFEGLSIVKQHQLVNKALKEEIKDMHGIRIETQPPKP